MSWRGAPPESRKLGPDKPSLIFVGDMSDLFHEDRDTAIIHRVLGPIVQSKHIGQLLTKRPQVARDFFIEELDKLTADQRQQVIRHLWLGFSAERQKEFDERWPYMCHLADLGFIVFLSYEPAIGPLDLPDDFLSLGKRAQVIAGGMSGSEAMPAHPDWFRSVRDQCNAAGVKFFFKQWGEFSPLYLTDNEALTGDHLTLSGKPYRFVQMGNIAMVRVGKKRAGRLLDGREWNEMPEVPA